MWEDELTFPRLQALYTEWGDEPPVAVFVASYFGYKKPNRQSDGVVNGFMMMAEFPSGVIGMN